MKKIISIILAVTLVLISIVPAFATTDVESAANELISDALGYMRYYAYNNMTYPYYYPIWSNTTADESIELYDEIYNFSYNSMEDVEAERAKLDQLCATATISKSELKFMIDLFEKENNDNNYYNIDTWNEFLNTLENGKTAYENGSEEDIHIAYVNMRNEYNKICLYNKNMGDINNDGVVSVLDATYLQKAVIGLVDLNSSQLTVAYDNSGSIIKPDITDATVIQKIALKIDIEINNYGSHITKLEDFGELPLYPEVRRFGSNTEPNNAVYYQYLINSKTVTPTS